MLSNHDRHIWVSIQIQNSDPYLQDVFWKLWHPWFSHNLLCHVYIISESPEFSVQTLPSLSNTTWPDSYRPFRIHTSSRSVPVCMSLYSGVREPHVCAQARGSCIPWKDEKNQVRQVIRAEPTQGEWVHVQATTAPGVRRFLWGKGWHFLSFYPFHIHQSCATTCG